MKFKAIVEYEYPGDHKPPVKAEIVLHGDRVITDNIKWVEQEFCDDAISRQVALKKLKESAEHHANDSREEALLRRDRDIIRALPPVTPQYTDAEIQKIQELEQAEIQKAYELGKPKTGHWIVVSDGYGDNAYICECSECKDTVWVYKDADRKWNYCPNCGAKMVDPKESEDNEET